MKKIFCGVFLALFISMFMTACNDRPVNGSSESSEAVETAESQDTRVQAQAESSDEAVKDDETGYFGEVLDGYDTNTATGGESVAVNEGHETIDKEGNTLESVPKDNLADSDLIAPPSTGSDGVL